MAALNVSVEQNLWKSSSRRSSMESILSIQGKETDYVQDTSDTESCASDSEEETSANEPEEYEPVTDQSEDAPISNESDGSEDQIISTKVVEVSVRDDGELSFADGEADDSDDFDKELGFHDYWKCAQCSADNNTPWYRYCQKCFQVRKNFFPPRPKRKGKRRTEVAATLVSKTESHDSDVDSGISQGFSQSQESIHPTDEPSCSQSSPVTLKRLYRKRHSSISSLCSESDHEISKKPKITTPILKTVSDPQLTVECDKIKLTKKAIANSLKEKLESDNLCMICLDEPKTGVFVHGRIAHICCCYKCSLKVWSKAKRCPLCNCKVSNVLRAVM